MQRLSADYTRVSRLVIDYRQFSSRCVSISLSQIMRSLKLATPSRFSVVGNDKLAQVLPNKSEYFFLLCYLFKCQVRFIAGILACSAVATAAENISFFSVVCRNSLVAREHTYHIALFKPNFSKYTGGKEEKENTCSSALRPRWHVNSHRSWKQVRGNLRASANARTCARETLRRLLPSLSTFKLRKEKRKKK